ncbi:MAG: YfiR family protein [Sterolibacteriaceae bacterium]|nr:YfiR family protein [Sterolibacteriaceae bacterium]
MIWNSRWSARTCFIVSIWVGGRLCADTPTRSRTQRVPQGETRVLSDSAMIHLRIPPVLRMVCGLLLALLGSAPPVQAQALSEAQIKAGFIYNFARYIRWPAEAFFGKDASFVMCLVGRDRWAPARFLRQQDDSRAPGRRQADGWGQRTSAAAMSCSSASPSNGSPRRSYRRPKRRC